MLFLILFVLTAGFLGFLALTEYRPAPREPLEVAGGAAESFAPDAPLTVMTWNIGFGALDAGQDSFMVGGKTVKVSDAGLVRRNLNGILAEIEARRPDVMFLQEIDLDASRSCHIDELALFRSRLTGAVSSFARNFKVAFVPYPIPPLGKVDSGIATFTRCAAASAERAQLPVPFSWPVRMVNLKRCALVTRLPLRGCPRELVLINLHLEAFDDGAGRAAQTAMLAELMAAEAEKGNYVVAGGDFNQTLPSADPCPVRPGKWTPGQLDGDAFPGSWQFVMDGAAPTCRSLDRPYAGADRESFQFYRIDGFIVSGNVTVERFAAADLDFVHSDHNPVVMTIRLEDPRQG